MMKLDNISPTVCLSKWMKPSIRLERGISSMCHHTRNLHFGPDSAEEIKIDSHALVNNKRLLRERQDMLLGKRPKGCNYCWDMEDRGEVSDRIVTSKKWEDRAKDITKTPWTIPEEIEVSFDNTCNLKCIYCNPLFSSKWAEEYRKFGDFGETNNLTPHSKLMGNWENFDSTPYVKAFWEWLPEIINEVKRIRVTGGEPLLSKNTFRLIDYVNKKNPKIVIAINSNFCVPEKNFIRFLNKIKNIEKVVLFLSIESHGKKAEYARYGLDYNKFLKNIDIVLSDTKNTILVPMMTLNALSVCSLKEFWEDWNNRIDKWGSSRIKQPDTTNYLSGPRVLDARILPNDFLNKYSYIENAPPTLFKRFFDRSTNETFVEARKGFVSYINEIDKRRGTSFGKIFPELNELKEKWNGYS